MKKTVIITGASSGIGLTAARILASTNEWHVVLACRSIDKTNEAVKSITVDFVKRWGNRRIDCLALNAGVHTGYVKEHVVRSKQGFETTIATNHIGHFYLMNQLLPQVKSSSYGRIVIVGSEVHNPDESAGKRGQKATLGDLSGYRNGFKHPNSMIDGSSPFDPEKAYKDSKLCNILTTLELSRRLTQQNSHVTCNCMSPGLIPTTGLFREFNSFLVNIFIVVMKYVLQVAVTEEEGGRKLVYMITNDELNGKSGLYYGSRKKTMKKIDDDDGDDDGDKGSDSSKLTRGDMRLFGPILPSIEARDEKQAELLWNLTEQLIDKELN